MSSTTGQPEDGAKHPDRRIERTRRALMNALMDLIAEQGYEKTTVQGILDRANVGRSTFYAHYFNKQDLLLRGFALGRLGHDERADAESPDAPNLTALFAHAAQMREHVKGLEGSQAFEVAVQLTLEDLENSFQSWLEEVAGGNVEEPPIWFLAQFLSGGMIHLLLRHARENTSESAETMNRWCAWVLDQMMHARGD